jgi:hypothetical protein
MTLNAILHNGKESRWAAESKGEGEGGGREKRGGGVGRRVKDPWHVGRGLPVK